MLFIFHLAACCYGEVECNAQFNTVHQSRLGFVAVHLALKKVEWRSAKPYQEQGVAVKLWRIPYKTQKFTASTT